LESLAADILLAEKTVATNMAAQLALWAQSHLTQTKLVALHASKVPQRSTIQPDMIVFPNTGYYYAAMRHDLSFENNLFAHYLDMVESNKYDKTCSSSTPEVKWKDRKK